MIRRFDNMCSLRSRSAWRMFVVGLGALILNACCTPHRPLPPSTCGASNGAVPFPILQPPAPSPQSHACGPFNGQPGDCGENGCPPGLWTPPGIACPWPSDEYLCDGGDKLPEVQVARDRQVYGLHEEDTIAHFDQRDGRTEVEASNRVCIYAPRFASVRHIAPMKEYESIDEAGRVHSPVKLARADEVQRPTPAAQRIPPGIDLGIKRQSVFAALDKNAVVTRDLLPVEAVNGFRAHEDFTIIRWGFFEQTEKARLAQRIDAAVVWSSHQAMQVIVQGRPALSVEGDRRAQATFTVDPAPPAKLRLVKVADKCDAQTGEIVEFTIRFDNVGASEMHNVTLVDNLTTRLEYVPGSQSSSVKAEFSTQPNEQGSLVLRWDLADPIKPSQGGLLRFKCKVR